MLGKNNGKDLSQYKRMIDIFSLDFFFLQNSSPTIRKYPHLSTFKADFVSFSERHRKAKKEEKDPRAYMLLLEDKEITDQAQIRKIGRDAIRYINTRSIMRILSGYFSLMEYHREVSRSFPELFDTYLSVVMTIFASTSKRKIEKLVREANSETRMHEFYKELYAYWESEVSNIEKQLIED